MLLVGWVCTSCRLTGELEAPEPALVVACETVLRRAIDEARHGEGATPELVHVRGTDPSCAAAAERVAIEPGVEPWTKHAPPRCPGRRCGPRDGNPLVMVHHDHADCFRVARLRWTGGHGETRCVEEPARGPGVGPLHDDVVVY